MNKQLRVDLGPRAVSEETGTKTPSCFQRVWPYRDPCLPSCDFISGDKQLKQQTELLLFGGAVAKTKTSPIFFRSQTKTIRPAASQRMLPLMLPAHAFVQRWRMLKCIPITCFLTSVSWDRSVNTQCKFCSLTLTLLSGLIRNDLRDFMQNIPHQSPVNEWNESKNRL